MIGPRVVGRAPAEAIVRGAVARRRRFGSATLGRTAVAAGLAVAATIGCARPSAPPAPSRPALGDVIVRDVTSPVDAPVSVDRAALARALGERLRATNLFSSAPPDAGVGPVARLQVVVAFETAEVGDKGEARARVRLTLATRPSDAPGAVAFDVEGGASQAYVAHGAAPDTLPSAATRGRRRSAAARPPAAAADHRALFEALALRVADDLIDDFVARRQIADGPAAAVHAALIADGGELRAEAIRAVGRRRLRDEAPALLKLLSDPDEPTRDAALGALIELGDRRAVAELTRTRSLRDRHEMHKIIAAIAILGGREADDYLSFVAATHDDDEIRAEAAEARARLLKRQGEAGAAP